MIEYIYALSSAGFFSTIFSKDSLYNTFSRTEYISSCIFSKSIHVVLRYYHQREIMVLVFCLVGLLHEVCL